MIKAVGIFTRKNCGKDSFFFLPAYSTLDNIPSTLYKFIFDRRPFYRIEAVQKVQTVYRFTTIVIIINITIIMDIFIISTIILILLLLLIFSYIIIRLSYHH
jgi:uncharacterized membrane protein